MAETNANGKESEVGCGSAGGDQPGSGGNQPSSPAQASGQWPPSRRGRWLRAIGLSLALTLFVFFAAAEYVARHLGPLLRSSVVATLSGRFHAPVELGSLQASVVKGWGGIEVEGSGLRVLGPASFPVDSGQPLLSLRRFRFRASLTALLHRHLDLAWVSIDGLNLHLPRHREPGGAGSPPGLAAPKPPIRITLHSIECRNATLSFAPSGPGKAPLILRIQNLKLTVPEASAGGPGRALLYDAQIINPKPVGDIHAIGHFGPWNHTDPRSTPVDGHYTFRNVDLSSIRGIAGTLFSEGDFNGRLDQIEVNGVARTPDFRLDVSSHPLPLSTTFHAYVNATDGDTTLSSVQAVLQHSHFTAQGSIMNIHGKGHDIHLVAHMPNGRIEDVLRLTARSAQPAMVGTVTLGARIQIPRGSERVIQRLEAEGTMNLHERRFTNAKLQDRIDSLSLRAQGEPREAAAAQAGNGQPQAASQMAVEFSFDQGMLVVPSLNYVVPGGTAQLHGAYFLNAGAFQFVGFVRTQAKASQMVTGWKSVLLLSLNSVFKAPGAGLQLPVSISGEHNTVRFGLDSRGVDEPAAQIAAGLRATYPAPAAGSVKYSPGSHS